MKVLRFTIVVLLLLLQSRAFATTYYAVTSGNWSGNIWSTTPNGVGGALPTLVNGDIIVISDVTVTVDVQYTTTASITLNMISNSASVTTELAFGNGKKLSFGAGSAVYLSKNDPSYLDPKITGGGGGGNANYIEVGGTSLWQAGDGNISGTGQLSGGVLPITLSEFGASLNREQVELKWTTTAEINFDYFEIEKSVDGENFSTIIKIPGHGTSHEVHQYSFIDRNPFIGKNYYRLRSTDFDGYTETFKVINISYQSEKSFSVYPNPSEGAAIHFALNYVPNGNYIIAIYDTKGNVIDRLNSAQSLQDLSYNYALSSGVYFAKLITEDFVKVERFIVK